MAQRPRLPAWKWIVGAVLSTAVVLLGYRAVQTDQQLQTLRTELVTVKEEAAKFTRLAEDRSLQLKEAERQLERLSQTLNQAEAEASEREERIAMLSQGMATCDELFEEGDEVKASAPSTLAIFRIAREAAAAKDCLDKGDVATACKHWQGLLVKIERMGSPVRESRVEIEDLLRQNHCQHQVGPAPAHSIDLQLNLDP
jgi:predicted nuclease with TOPRIM domain